MRAWSLRARLTALSAGVTMLLLAVTTTVLLGQLRAGLLDAVDSAAVGRAGEVAALVNSGRLAAVRHLPSRQDIVVQVIGPQGQVLASSDNAAGRGRLFSHPPAPGARTVQQVVVRHDTIDYRVATVAAAGNLVYAAVPVDDVQDGVNLLARQLAISVPLLLALITAGAWLLIGRALQPVELLRRQADRLQVSDLSGRVDVLGAPELKRLAVTLNQLLERVETATRQQRTFLDDAAHELRNPVAALLASLEVHQRTTDHPDAPELTQQALRISELVTDLLTLARIDGKGSSSQRRVDLSRLVAEELAARPNVVANLQPAWVLADAAMMRQVVANLLDNAERHANRSVLVRTTPEGRDSILEVSDDGPGVPEADRERIFERFARLDPGRARDEGGVGLGLAIARAAIVSAGGSLHVEDAAPGARFVVRLPSQPAPPEARGGETRG